MTWQAVPSSITHRMKVTNEGWQRLPKFLKYPHPNKGAKCPLDLVLIHDTGLIGFLFRSNAIIQKIPQALLNSVGRRKLLKATMPAAAMDESLSDSKLTSVSEDAVVDVDAQPLSL